MSGAVWRHFISIALFLPAFAHAEVSRLSTKITLEDPYQLLSPRLELFQQNMNAAVSEWGKHIESTAELNILVRVQPSGVGRIDAASVTNIPLKTRDGRKILQDSAAYKVMTGKPVDPSKPDILIRINPEYLVSQIWLDPHPGNRTDPVPKDKIDGVSLLAHEIFHALGFSTLRNLQTWNLPPGYASVFDSFIQTTESGNYFFGQRAMKAFGGPVPLTSVKSSQDIFHYGNPGDGTQALHSGLMNGVHLKRGHRYRISPLDLAILADLGLPVRSLSIAQNAQSRP